MKLICILLGSLLSMAAQTNAPLTNLWFTNLQGRVYSNATLISNTPSGILISWNPYGMGPVDSRIAFTNLPSEARRLFHYDTNLAALAEETEHMNGFLHSLDAASAAKRNKALAAAKASERRDLAEVFQIVNDGVLVHFLTGIGPIPDWYAQAAVDGTVKPDYSFGRQLVMLWQYPNKNLVDGQFLMVTNYPIGTYHYETVNGSGKTIPRYTDWLDTAAIWKESPESEIFQPDGPDGRNFSYHPIFTGIGGGLGGGLGGLTNAP